MLELHVSRPVLLEVGEESQLALRVADGTGKTSEVDPELWLVNSDHPEIVTVNGFRLTAITPGSATITVRSVMKTQPEERSWIISVIDRRASASIHLNERPRIQFTDVDLRVFRERIKEPSDNPINEGGFIPSKIQFFKLWKVLLHTADEYVKEERFDVHYPSVSNVMPIELPLTEPMTIPNPAGYVDYPFWTMFSRAVEERLTVLSTVYLVTGAKVYSEKVRMYLVGLAGFSKWYEFDHRGAEGNLSNAHFVLGAAIGYDAVRDILTEEDRKQVADALLYRGLQPLAIDIGNTDMHNIIAAKQVAMMFGAAALYGDSPYVSKYMEQAYDYLMSYLDRKLQSCETEGLLYDNVAAKHIWMAADLYRRVTGDASLCSHPYLKDELPERFFRFLSTGNTNTFPNFADSFLKLDISYMMSMLASHHAHPVAMWYVEQYEAEKPSVLMNLREIPSAVSPEGYYGDKLSQAFRTIGWASLRSGWGERDHLLAFTSSGSDRDHTHKDQNNLMMNVAGEWLLTNPGYQDYVPGPRADYTVGTVGHNSLLMNGQGQPIRGGGSLTEVWMAPRFEVVQGDATASYQGLLQSYRRSVLHLNRSYFVVWDEVETNAADDAPQLLFHTAASNSLLEQDKVLRPGDALAGQEASIRGEKASLQLKVVYPPETRIRVAEYPGAESYGPYLSIQELVPLSTSKQFLTVLRPSTAGKPIAVSYCTEIAADSGSIHVTFDLGDEACREVLMLQSREIQEMHYAGCLFKGRALWAKEDRSMLAAWDAERIHAENEFTLQADAPVSICLDTCEDAFIIRNSHERSVGVTISAPDRNERRLTLSPGEHSLRWIGYDKEVND